MMPPARSKNGKTSKMHQQLAFQGEGRLAAIKGDNTLADLAQHYDVHPNQITAWRAQLAKGAADVFGAEPGGMASPPVVDLKLLHSKIGELALENDFYLVRSAKPAC
jgi:transposase